jgi:selenocysteine-specific elongation factor
MAAIRSVIVGTAGHIDHGKSSLVEALTGVDPDRLEEEQRRGMTIDLGFAPYRHASGALVGFIDVPGHERFIKNMVAGATSVDIALLVVAADDGVMPQTREHLAILGLLGVQRGLVALTKVDLVEPGLVELARQDVVALLAGGPLEGAAVLPVSTVTGAGLTELRAALDALIDAVPGRSEDGPFRLPVQRVFSAKGHGTVVTGRARQRPGGGRRRARGRGQGAAAARARRASLRRRARGGPGRPQHRAQRLGRWPRGGPARRRRRPARRVRGAAQPVAAYRHVHDEPLRNRSAVRLHVGTAEVLGEAVLLEADSLARGAEGFVQLRLEEPVVTAPGDRYLLRHASSMAVLGGGTVVAPTDGRLKRFKERVLREASERLAAQGDPLALAHVVLGIAGRRGGELTRLAVETGVAPPALRERLQPEVAAGRLACLGSLYLDPAALAEVADELAAALRAEHAAHPLHDWADLAAARRAVVADEAVLAAALAADRRFETASGGRVRLAGHRAQLGSGESAAREQLLAALEQGGAAPPPVDARLTGLPEARHRALVESLRAAGEVVAVGPHLFSAAALARLKEAVRAHGRARHGAIDIPVLRDELGTTRKYLIPLLEHFDAQGLTVRHGERRTLRHVDAPG